ncbi:MAG: hypothetical protein ACYDAG_12525, partial [Chloroflexota bacterium]
GFFILAAQGVFVLGAALWLSRRALVRPWLLVQAAIGLCYLPWVAVAHGTLTSYSNGLVSAPTLAAIVRILIPTFLMGHASFTLPREAYVLAGALLAAGVLAPLLRARPPLRVLEMVRGKAGGIPSLDASLLLACLLAVPVLAVYAGSLVRPMFFQRYMVVMEPGFLLALAGGIVALARWFRPLALPFLAAAWVPAALILPAYYGTVLYARGSDVRHLLAFVDTSARPGAAFIVNLPPSDPMYRYYQPAQPTFFIPNPPAGQQAAAEAALTHIVQGHSEVWFTPWNFDHTAFVERWLDEHAFRVDQHWFANAEVIRYESPLPPPPATPSTATFIAPDAHIDLRSFDVYTAKVTPGQPLLFTLLWQANAHISERYKVFAHLLDAHNHVVTQRDDEPVAGKRPTPTWKPGETIADNYALVVPPSTPPGQYEIEVGLYLVPAGARLHLAGGGNRVVIAHITVAG